MLKLFPILVIFRGVPVKKSPCIKFRVQPTPVHCGKFQKNMAKSDEALDRVRKQLRSVLISEKHGVAVERVERDYLELV